MFAKEIERLAAVDATFREVSLETGHQDTRVIVELMAKASLAPDSEDFAAIARVAGLRASLDVDLFYPALAVLPAWGEQGVLLLHDMALHDGLTNSTGALNVLAAIAVGRTPSADDLFWAEDYWDSLDKYTVTPDLVAAARTALRQVIAEHLSSPATKSSLLGKIAEFSRDETKGAGMTEVVNLVVDMLVDFRMLLNTDIIKAFEGLLKSGPAREEQLHRFLVDHPVLLDPFVTELRSKHELGSDFITDFVIRRINNEYVIVEIENSTDELFTKDGTFTSNLMKAIAQVRDFQAWLGDNLGYAQKKLPGIRRPEGLVIIGRRSDLSSVMETRLSEENFSRRGHIKIVTFDDLLGQAEVVYKNMLERPLVLRTGDQKTI